MNLSRHFTLAEAVFSDTAERLEIDNTPPSELIPAMQGLAENVLEPIRTKSPFARPFSPRSWFRSEELERELCKLAFPRWCARRALPPAEPAWQTYFARKSHPKGEAVDLQIPGTTSLELARWIEQNLSFDQLLLEYWDPAEPARSWVHVSYKTNGINRGEVLTIGTRGVAIGLPA